MSGPGSVPPGGHAARVIEAGAERAAKDELLLDDLRGRRPDLDFHRVGTVWLALPKGTPFTFAAILAGLAEELPAPIGTARPAP